MTHVSLFSGIGGLDLAAEWAGFRTILQVERDPYCLQVLERHWPEVPRITDIREVTSESVTDPVTVVSGGFPCQPFSSAGRRRGQEDDRYLWPQMLRAAEGLRPRWVVAENVPGLLSLQQGVVFDAVLADLEAAGYEVLPVVHPAAGVGAPHLRYRVFIVAHDAAADTKCGTIRQQREWEREQQEQPGKAESGEVRAAVRNANGDSKPVKSIDAEMAELPYVADAQELTERAGLRADEPQGQRGRRLGDCGCPRDAWSAEPGVCRVAHGIPNRVDRLRALGNAVVPAQAFPIFRAIAEMESTNGK